ncbi:MAG: hypothetical protein Hyperionvirus27_7 [Hyperionvirus sp.]|uniref:Uncharacterized protein n=1 Tax=Hyperionvirus sp. TaxID=2487770 RepID=A0A3G5ABC2_9VIRU|nr:MAG: hypothetical protein Hyperionvirus27_7 [Hyperionvirus sp.]
MPPIKNRKKYRCHCCQQIIHDRRDNYCTNYDIVEPEWTEYFVTEPEYTDDAYWDQIYYDQMLPGYIYNPLQLTVGNYGTPLWIKQTRGCGNCYQGSATLGGSACAIRDRIRARPDCTSCIIGVPPGCPP